SCRLDLFAIAEGTQEGSNQRVVLLNQGDGLGVSQVVFQLRGPDDVGEHQRQQTQSVMAAELFHLVAKLQLGCLLRETGRKRNDGRAFCNSSRRLTLQRRLKFQQGLVQLRRRGVALCTIGLAGLENDAVQPLEIRLSSFNQSRRELREQSRFESGADDVE